MRPSGPISLFVPSLRGGGTERVALTLASGFAERGLDVEVVVAAAEGAYGRQLPASLRVVDLARPRVSRAIVPLARYLRRRQPAALLALAYHANVAAVVAHKLAGSPARLVLSERNTLSSQLAALPRAKALLMRKLARRTYPRAQAVIAVSRGVAVDLERTLGATAPIVAIGNPAVTEALRFQARQPPPHPWLCEEVPVIVGAGRLVAAKDWPTLLRAHAAVRQHRTSRVIILGEGPERASLQALARKLGTAADVDLPGFVDAPGSYLARAAVFALSSRWEGLPNALIEAMALGVPVVATDCPSGPAEILCGGRFGHLVPVGDHDAMAEAVLEALARPDPAPKEAWERYTPERVLDDYLSVLGGD